MNEGKLNFVLHVGPPKTGTTTLQEELTSLAPLLASDNYAYLGNYLCEEKARDPDPLARILFHCDCFQEILQAQQNEPKINRKKSFNERFQDVKCWREASQRLQDYRSKNTNLIVCNEVWGTRILQKNGRSSLGPMVALLEQILGDDWKLIVVVGYRRYFEWLSSSKLHQDRYTPSKPRLNQWPAHNGRVLEPLLPLGLNILPGTNDAFPFYYTDSIIEHLKQYTNNKTIFKLLDLYETTTLRTTFLCSILPNAPKACQYSCDYDATHPNERRSNQRWDVQESYYDVLATTAAAQGFVDVDKYRRRDVSLLLRSFHQEMVANQSAYEFPLKCPSADLLERLLELSLEKEKELFPDCYENREKDHRDAFAQAVGEKEFCIVDAEAVLARPEWKTFLSDQFGKRAKPK